MLGDVRVVFGVSTSSEELCAEVVVEACGCRVDVGFGNSSGGNYGFVGTLGLHHRRSRPNACSSVSSWSACICCGVVDCDPVGVPGVGVWWYVGGCDGVMVMKLSACMHDAWIVDWVLVAALFVVCSGVGSRGQSAGTVP